MTLEWERLSVALPKKKSKATVPIFEDLQGSAKPGRWAKAQLQKCCSIAGCCEPCRGSNDGWKNVHIALAPPPFPGRPIMLMRGMRKHSQTSKESAYMLFAGACFAAYGWVTRQVQCLRTAQTSAK